MTILVIFDLILRANFEQKLTLVFTLFSLISYPKSQQIRRGPVSAISTKQPLIKRALML